MSSVPPIASPATLPMKVKVKRVAVCLVLAAVDAHGVAVDRAREIAGHEVAAVGAVDVVAALAQVRAWWTARGELDLHVPWPLRSAAGALRRRRRVLCGGCDSRRESRSATICASPAGIM